MTKQERKLTKRLLKEIERVAAHMRETKYDLPIKEAQLALLDENGNGIGLCMTIGIDEDTGEVHIGRSMEEITEEMEIEVELETEDYYADDFDEEWDSSFNRNPSSRLLN
tara:strand:- start:199 stop:528 length:330 start_codon:yes stop_codon:yes gene_type:complete